MHPNETIAIVGIGGLFPGAETLEQFWANVRAGVDSTSAVPPGRWLIEPDRAFDPRVAVADHVYSIRGGFIERPALDADGLDLDPLLLERLDPVFHLALHVARRAWSDAQTGAVNRDRVGVVFGNIVLPTETASELTREVLGAVFEEQLGLDAREQGSTEPLNAFPAGLPAALVARALGLRGPAYTIDAACGSSLYSLELAIDELRAGRADAMLCGGVSRPDPLYTQMGFSQLRALSARGKSAPLDQRADGLVVGEGAGMFVLKRLDDALAHGDQIYAVVAGIGLSNDIHGDLLAPSSEGQLRAMRMAYEQAGWSPGDVDLIECHAAGTAVGDAVEAESLKSLWGPSGWNRGQCTIGSVKSNVGHALTAAGAAGLLKVLLALKHETLPPTANFERSAPALGLEEGAFRVLTRADHWPRRAADQPRRAAISGFGFGGINCHVLIEEWDESEGRDTPARSNQVHADRDGSAISTPIVPINAVARFWEGEPPGEPQHHPRFWEGEPPGEPKHDPRFWEGEPPGEPRHDPRFWEGEPPGEPPHHPQFGEGEPPGEPQHHPRFWEGEPPGERRHDPARTEPRPPGSTHGDLAIVGLSAQFGPFDGKESFENYLLGYEQQPAANKPRNAWGIPESAFCESHRKGGGAFAGFYIDSLEFGIDQFRIPPKELGEMQPQQSLMLRVAAEAIGDARWDAQRALRTGVLIGIGLDLNTTNYYLRWSMAARARAWNQELGLALSSEELARWTDELTRSAGPALTANRTMGSLGGLIASRIAREFKIGGPCFTVSCDETSGMQALAIAAGWLRAGELDAVIVGAVDFAGDARAVIARRQIRGGASRSSSACDGAVALVVKRLEDAQRDGDRVYAVIGEIATGSGLSSSFASISDHSAHDIGSIEAHLGNAGAATGLGTVAMAALCLDRRMLPGSDPASGPSYWMRNRAEGPRRARVSETSLGDNHASLILEEFVGNRLTARRDLHCPRMGIGLFAIESNEDSGLADRVHELRDLARTSSARDIDMLAREWWQRHPNDPRLRFGTAVVADSVESLVQTLDHFSMPKHEQGNPDSGPWRLAFVYPGLGNQFAGMGRGLSALWPGVLDIQDSESDFLKEQLDPGIWWNGELPRAFDDHRSPILGSVSVGALVTDVLRSLGVSPDAAIGYSLGESAALVALRAWTDRDELLRRVRSSPLFHSELAGSCDAARRLWGIPSDQPVDWVAGIVTRSAESVQAAIGGQTRVYVLIRNTSDLTVIGGQRVAVASVVNALGCPFVELSTVSTVHCEIARTVETGYHALHDLATTAPEGIDFYSGASARPYPLDRQSAADAITAQALGTIDFPALIERAYHDGIRFFLEVGPGSSCTRLIGQILRGRPHIAISACRPDRDPLTPIVEVLAGLITHRLPVDLAGLYGHSGRGHFEQEVVIMRAENERRHKVRVDVRGGAFKVPALPARRATFQVAIDFNMDKKTEETLTPPVFQWSEESTAMPPQIFAGERATQTRDNLGMIRSSLVRSVHEAEQATGEAHQAFLRVAHGAADLIGKQLDYQHRLITDLKNGIGGTIESAQAHTIVPPADDEPASSAKPVLLDRTQCLEFAVGSIARVLGPDFAAIDHFPTRVRLPDEPLMLVDRILSIEGEPRSLERGRVVTEHVIEPGSWYLDAGRIAPCIAIEAGQADLFLCGYLGVDFETKGLAVYRLLDATVTFHRGLPAAGDVIRYDIRIANFFRQGKTILFRFQFEATVAGEPLLTMRDGCAGFFTAEELAAGKGIVPRSLDLPMKRSPVTADDTLLIPVLPSRLDENGVDALRRGDLAAAFGSPFDRIDLRDLLPLPGGRMSLVHRVAALDPTGGQWGLGSIRAEAVIRPGDWFMVCHFVDDRVMPGTLMYECCLHTLRILMMRLGWVGARGRVAYEPVIGVANRLRCRGQIVESTRLVTYEITIKERGFRPEPYAIADALILADGKPIVAVTDMALQLSGTSKQELELLWAGSGPNEVVRLPHAEKAGATSPPPGATGAPGAIFDHDRILAFAVGKPSAAFGDRYRAFDEGRFIARLPAPPYQFLDRITDINAKPWVMVPGGSAEAQFDVDPDAWYFSADRQDRMPYAVLLEVALQACGWMAAYMGSALTSDGDLKFRNLGGTGRQHLPVLRDTGTLTTRFRVTKISSLAGMILQHYEFAVACRHGLIYDGSAEFGFFDPRALEQQVGIRELVPYALSADERGAAESFTFPSAAPFPDARWRMIDRVDALVMHGGPHGVGFVQGTTRVDPTAWFFQAHFLDDPVWPGSLGLESLLQLLKMFAARRWGVGPSTVFESPVIGQSHGWTYRGQIIPTNQSVGVQAEIKVCDDRARSLVADGHLQVDGKVIYKMSDFSIRLVGG